MYIYIYIYRERERERERERDLVSLVNLANVSKTLHFLEDACF